MTGWRGDSMEGGEMTEGVTRWMVVTGQKVV